MSSAAGTFRGTPNRGVGRSQLPAFENSPSAIPLPRPKPETHGSSLQSDAGGSTMSASRAKQSKRDEVMALENVPL